jgi:antitoxin YefM
MHEPVVPTIDFSPAKAQLSDVMDDVFHRHRPRLVSRHHGKEQMLLVRPEDLVAMLGDRCLKVLAVYDGGEVTLRLPEMGLLGFGETLESAIDDLLGELRVYAERYFEEPLRYMASSRGAHAATLLAFALASEDEQRSMLAIDEEPAGPEVTGAR